MAMKAMNAAKKKRLERAGWAVGSTADFLRLSPEEAALVAMRLALSTSLRERRQRAHLTQTALAKRLGSSQSRVAKMEAGDPTVSLDLLIRSLLAMGASRNDLARVIASPKARSAA